MFIFLFADIYICMLISELRFHSIQNISKHEIALRISNPSNLLNTCKGIRIFLIQLKINPIHDVLATLFVVVEHY